MTQVDHEHLCPACGSENTDGSIDAFEAVCDNCGFVIREDVNSVSLEWEVTNGTFQRSENKDWLTECRVRNATEQQLANAFEVLEDFAAQLNLSDEVHEGTVDIYCDAFRAGLTDGRKTICVVATCLCLSSRRAKMPIPTNRLLEFDDVERTKLSRSRRALCEELGIKARTPEPDKYIPFIESELDLTSEEVEEVEKLLTSVRGMQKLVGKDPAGTAAGGVYVVQEEYTQKQLAEVVGVSAETVRQRVNDLGEVVDYV